jgi:hypothetical protein
MATRPGTKTLFKSAEPRDDADERHGQETEDLTPRNIPPNTAPTEGFSLEIDGKSKSQHATIEAATAVGAELKRKFPVLQVVVFDAVSKTRTPVEAAK